MNRSKYTEIIRTVTSFVLGGAALAFGVSFGLGTQTIVRNLSAGFYTRKYLEVGRHLEISGNSGQLTAITPTHAILENESGRISIANALFFEEIARQ